MFKKILIVLAMVVTSLFAISQNDIKGVMTVNINKVLMVLKDNSLEKNIKNEKIITLMDEVFDYDLMSRISLGREWRDLKESEQKEFTDLFTKKLKNSYIDKLDLYTDQAVVVKEAKEIKKDRVFLYTDLVGKDDKYEIIYKFYRDKSDDWKIYDVDIVGVSIIQTYRQQFSGFLKNNTFKDLLASLNK